MKKKFLNALWRCERMTGERLRQIRSYFPDLETAWQADVYHLITAGIKPETAQEIAISRQGIDPDREWERLEKLNIKILDKQDNIYPALLREISSPPEVLYVKGELRLEDQLSLTIVGSRAVTQYGRQIIEKVVEPIASSGVTIVSGLALGVDGLAHQAALKVGGRTIAVLANGLDNIYPATHNNLAEKIIDGQGALISEYPLDTEPLPQRFPVRNRIVAGFSQGTLVIEAALKSGSLITAQMALDSGREVFAVPGSIFSKHSEGTNNLFKNSSAYPVVNADDILTLLNVNKKSVQIEFNKSICKNPIEAQILGLLTHETLSMDEIVKKTNLNPSDVASALTLMEMRGQARFVGGGSWIKN